MRVKVCGIKTVEDAIMAAHCGADAIGLLVGQRHVSEDFINIDLARDIVKKCPPFVSTVLVTHLIDPKEIAYLASQIGVTTIQLHSDCDIQNIRSLRKILPCIKLIKNFHVTGPEIIPVIRLFEDVVDAFHLDTLNLADGKVGGTGLTHDWNISRDIVQEVSIPVILAGGLNPKNVAEAIKVVTPFGVDANTGLKASNGFEDCTEVATFAYRAKLEFLKVRNLLNREFFQ
ncbi:phosphoribosylanthranilate isomerase [Candidatus Pacearchaeota archaeon]|nr:phosphoribosylanthranilate isomerase [Candidatus Pacearchaeota archaeon]